MTTVHKVESQCICCFVVFFLAWIFIKVWLQIFITFCLLVYLLYIYFVNNIQIFTIYSTLIRRWTSMFTIEKPISNQWNMKKQEAAETFSGLKIEHFLEILRYYFFNAHKIQLMSKRSTTIRLSKQNPQSKYCT